MPLPSLTKVKPTMIKSLFTRSALIAAGLMAVSSLAVHAQDRNTKVGDPVVEVLPSPNIDGGISKRFSPKDWIEIEVPIRIKRKPEPESGYLDNVTVKWYILVENPSKNVKFLKLTETIQHINLPIDEEVYSSVYLSPSTLRKMTGNSKASASTIVGTGCEVLVDGVLVGTVSKGPGGERWWTKSSAQVATSENFKLLTKADTPFAPLWWDRYLEIRPKQ